MVNKTDNTSNCKANIRVVVNLFTLDIDSSNI